ncbi:MAG TPA: hypothetical protein VGL23_17120 [Chloroflexota bacterium]
MRERAFLAEWSAGADDVAVEETPILIARALLTASATAGRVAAARVRIARSHARLYAARRRLEGAERRS